MENDEIAFGYGHVWFGELANQVMFNPSKVEQRSLETNFTQHEEERCICLKLILPGLVGSFGKLGCRFIPAIRKDTLIKVGIYEAHENLGLKIGLSDELADAVLSEATTVLADRNFLGSGILYFDRGEYHEVDSNRTIFKLLTDGLIAFLDPHRSFKTKEDVDSLIVQLLQDMRRRQQSKFMNRLEDITVFSSPEGGAEFSRKQKAKIMAGVEAMKQETAERKRQQAEAEISSDSPHDPAEENNDDLENHH